LRYEHLSRANIKSILDITLSEVTGKTENNDLTMKWHHHHHHHLVKSDILPELKSNTKS